MLTPFLETNRIDWTSLERLVEWYLANGASALFAVCQSSEMQALTVEERVDLARATVQLVAGRVPVSASGHVAEMLDEQAAELTAVADAGVDALVLVTNRLDTSNSGVEAFRRNLAALMARLPTDLPLGLYECPAPYRRLLSDDEFLLCRDTGRFCVLKDVSCNLATVARRARLAAGTSLAVINANAAIAWQAMLQGSRGFSGVFTNFHPDLYAWLYRRDGHDATLVDELVTFLALAAMAEGMGYPRLAKRYLRDMGILASHSSRVIEYDIDERHWAATALLDQIRRGTDRFRRRIAALGTRDQEAATADS